MEDLKSLIDKHPGAILVNGEPYTVPDSTHEFVLILIEYCQLCSSLPATSVELGMLSLSIYS